MRMRFAHHALYIRCYRTTSGCSRSQRKDTSSRQREHVQYASMIFYYLPFLRVTLTLEAFSTTRIVCVLIYHSQGNADTRV
jgi:hypothetical protein